MGGRAHGFFLKCGIFLIDRKEGEREAERK
jgi:hypothetical protein